MTKDGCIFTDDALAWLSQPLASSISMTLMGCKRRFNTLRCFNIGKELASAFVHGFSDGVAAAS